MILGIDLGTSNSMAAVYKNGAPVLIKSRTGRYTIPSVISIDENGTFYTGDVAKERMLAHPNYTVSSFKRSMGTEEMFQLGDMKLKAEELSSVLLKSIKEDAEQFLSERVTDAVICVPAFFNNPQRKAVMRAAELAGLNVKKLINEPTSAAIAYGMINMNNDMENQNFENSEEHAIIVLDLGGGTFDISVMEVTGNIMEVVAVCGDNTLGGDDFTRRLITLFLQANSLEDDFTLEENTLLWHQAQRAKYQISTEGRGEMHCILNNKEYSYQLTEEEYETACFDLLEKIRKLTLQAVEESQYAPWEIDDILIVGGGTKLSIVKKMIEKMAGRSLDDKINPDQAVAIGAAMQGALIEKNENVQNIIITDICPYYIGVNVWYNSGCDINKCFDVIIPKNTTIPAKRVVVHSDRPGTQSFNEIIQSGNPYGIDGVSLGGIHYARPESEKEKVDVQKIITYDTNGIIYVEYYVPENGMRFEMILKNDTCELTDEEVKKRQEELKFMNMGDRLKEEDNLLIARAERLYAEYPGKDRELISQQISIFEQVMKNGKKTLIAQARKQFEEFLKKYKTTDEIL